MLTEKIRARYLNLSEKPLEGKYIGDAFITLMESLPYAAMLIHKDRVVVSVNKAASNYGVVVGTNCWDTFGKRASIPEADKQYIEKHKRAPKCGTHCVFCHADEAMESHKPVNYDIVIGETTLNTFWVPVSDDLFLHYAIDVTKERTETKK